MRVSPLPWLTILAALGAALWLRFGVIEQPALGFACDAGSDAAVCTLRWIAVQSFHAGRLGQVAIFLGVLAALTRSATVAWAAGLVGIAGLVLYTWEFSAVGFLLGALTLARTQVDEARDEHCAGQQRA